MSAKLRFAAAAMVGGRCAASGDGSADRQAEREQPAECVVWGLLPCRLQLYSKTEPGLEVEGASGSRKSPGQLVGRELVKTGMSQWQGRQRRYVT